MKVLSTNKSVPSYKSVSSGENSYSDRERISDDEDLNALKRLSKDVGAKKQVQIDLDRIQAREDFVEGEMELEGIEKIVTKIDENKDDLKEETLAQALAIGGGLDLYS